MQGILSDGTSHRFLVAVVPVGAMRKQAEQATGARHSPMASASAPAQTTFDDVKSMK